MFGLYLKINLDQIKPLTRPMVHHKNKSRTFDFQPCALFTALYQEISIMETEVNFSYEVVKQSVV